MSSAPDVFTLLWAGIATGSIYAFIAVGSNVIFSASGVLNFAQGGYFMLGGMLGVFGVVTLGLPVLLSLAIVLAVVTILGLIQERMTVRPALKYAHQEGVGLSGTLAWLLGTFAVGLLIEAVTSLTMGGDLRAFPAIVPVGQIDLGVFGSVTHQSLLLIISAALLTTFVGTALNRTLPGQSMRALAFDPEAANIRGIPANTLSALAFGGGAAMAALGGFLGGPSLGASSSLGLLLLLKGFIAAVLGGMPSVKGALFGAYLLGVLELFIVEFIGAGYRNVALFSIIVVILVLRPRGIFAQAEARVV